MPSRDKIKTRRRKQNRQHQRKMRRHFKQSPIPHPQLHPCTLAKAPPGSTGSTRPALSLPSHVDRRLRITPLQLLVLLARGGAVSPPVALPSPLPTPPPSPPSAAGAAAAAAGGATSAAGPKHSSGRAPSATQDATTLAQAQERASWVKPEATAGGEQSTTNT